ncbi:hypothetical protein VNO77_02982 [Canavalia gladiata]|uniref:Uncharacterized protein n=1 Tax=Canavalia gladiata TaxID=3824 RepID=A0AAN9MUQ5_CANGL
MHGISCTLSVGDPSLEILASGFAYLSLFKVIDRVTSQGYAGPTSLIDHFQVQIVPTLLKYNDQMGAWGSMCCLRSVYGVEEPNPEAHPPLLPRYRPFGPPSLPNYRRDPPIGIILLTIAHYLVATRLKPMEGLRGEISEQSTFA